MDKKSFHPVPEELPAPEELFHRKDQKEKKPVSVSRRKPIPRYKVIKCFSMGFLVLIILLVLVMMNLDKFGIRFYNMMSSSMESVIPKGSLMLEYKPKADKLKIGDAVTYVNSEGISVTHEIIDVIPFGTKENPFVFRTKGTENKKADQEIVTYTSICGKVIFHIPYMGDFLSKL